MCIIMVSLLFLGDGCGILLPDALEPWLSYRYEGYFFICIARVLFIYKIYFYIFYIYGYMFSFLVIVSFITIIGESVTLYPDELSNCSINVEYFNQRYYSEIFLRIVLYQRQRVKTSHKHFCGIMFLIPNSIKCQWLVLKFESKVYKNGKNRSSKRSVSSLF